MKKRVVSVLLVSLLLLGLAAPILAAGPQSDMPEVSPDVEAFVAEVFFRQFGATGSIEQCKVASVEKVHGSVAAVQYANLMNYYYDTLDDGAFILAKDSFLLDHATSPALAADGTTEYLPTCFTLTEDVEPWVAENCPYLLGYTPVSPRPDRSKIDLDAVPNRDYAYLAEFVSQQEGQATTTVVATPTPTVAPVITPAPTPAPAPTSVTQPFPDVAPGDWFYEAVNAMKNSGIITGCDDGLFHPERTIKQGEFYAMLLRAGSFPGANISGGYKLSDHWASGVMLVAHHLNFYPNLDTGWDKFFVDGGTDALGRKYRAEYSYPEESVDRAEAVTRMIVLLNKISRIEPASIPLAGPMTYNAIPDHAEIETYITSGGWRDGGGYFTSIDGVRETIAYAYNIGVCKGVDEAGTFDPDKLLTRAEIAQLFYNAGITTRQNCLPAKQVIGAYDFNSTENVVR